MSRAPRLLLTLTLLAASPAPAGLKVESPRQGGLDSPGEGLSGIGMAPEVLGGQGRQGRTQHRPQQNRVDARRCDHG